ncbi:MAG: tetraacyldisaccharide 4'-kinase, partial [Bacteroidales bacterium]|nr:tetraacyldisaccharide 4'-kinase [Bacteroidales bacterium]
FQVGDLFSSSSQMGDEPMQFQHKFKDIVIAVDENRFHGINELCHRYPKLQIVLLDDAFQHRSVKPGLSILLTDYYHPYFDDYLLLAGNLRETKSGAQRADIIVVTKSPKVLSPFIRDSYKESLKPLPHQRLFFSYIRYGTIQPFDIEKAIVPKAKKVNTILLIAGIADTYPLEDHLKQLCFELITLQFSDHHQYTSKDIARITTMWNNIFTTNKLLLTTEKDAMRLKDPLIQELIVHLPLHYIPIEVEFHDRDKVLFDKQILEYAKKNRRDT